MNISVDHSKCIGCGMCEFTAPTVFHLENHRSTVKGEPADLKIYRRACDAANGCPVNAIEIQP